MDNFIQLINFMSYVALYLIPSLIGSLVCYCIKGGKSRKKQAMSSILRIIIYALSPAMLMAAAHGFIAERISDSNLRLGIAFAGGMVGEEITKALSSIKSILKSIYKFKKIASIFNNTTEAEIDEILRKNKRHKKEDD